MFSLVSVGFIHPLCGSKFIFNSAQLVNLNGTCSSELWRELLLGNNDPVC